MFLFKLIMKFIFRERLLILFFIINSLSLCSELSKKVVTNKPVASLVVPKDDAILGRIRKFIYHYAEKLSKKSDLKIKRKISGQLPDSYPKIMVKNAQKSRLDRNFWNKYLAYPTKIWRMCVYPEYIFKLNIMKWCEEKFSSKKAKKLVACKNTFCTVCCDHLQFVLKNQADKQILGEMLWLKNNPGFTKIKSSIAQRDLNKCSLTCNKVYPVKFPVKLPPPPRDKNLGKTPDSPARNCKDIQIWGKREPKSGEYWVELGSKGKTKVFCDMETDGGGWMLFFNYLHYPGQELTIDSSRLPSNLKDNNHINLKEIGFKEKDIQELRFFCTERSSTKVFWHFKLNSPEFINLALSGDQRFLKDDSLINSGYYDLPFPGAGAISWKRTIDKDSIGKTRYVGTSKTGGFWDTPFGSDKYNKYWTIKGNVKKGGRFECGSSHKDGATNPLASLVMTHHTIWFKGAPATEAQARERFITRNTNKK